MTPDEKAHYAIPRSALQETSPAFSVSATLMGDDLSNFGFVGKIWLRASVVNNTKYSFKQPVVLFIAERGFEGVENEVVNQWPSSGIMLLSADLLAPPWRPGDTVVVTGDIDMGSEDLQDWEIQFVDYVSDVLELPRNRTTQIDEHVTTVYRMARPVDCLRQDCPYKKLKKTDPLYCGEKD
jgi:hypothetical protein